MKRITFLILIITFMGLVDTFPSIQTQTSVTNPGTFVNEVAIWNPQNLDPATNHASQGEGIIQLCYEGLLRYTDNSINTLSDSLAYTNYTISSDGLQYTFYLKPNISFALQPGETVGQPFNAYVMQYSLYRSIIMNDPNGHAPGTIDQFILGAKNISSNNNLNIGTARTFLNLQSIHAINAYKLQINISEPFLGFIQTLMSPVAYAISPKAIIDNAPSNYTTNMSDTSFGMVPLTYFFPGINNATILSDLGLPSNYNLSNSGVVPNSPANVGSSKEYTWTNTHSAGTGPYIVTNNIFNSGATLKINPNWWNNASLPSSNGIDTIIWNQVPDIDTRIMDLANGTADSIEVPFVNLGQILNLTTLQPLYPGINVNSYLNFNNEFIGMNFNNSLSSNLINESSDSNYSINGGNYTRLLKYSWNDANGNPQMASSGNPFTSLLFRKAFAYIFDYNTYINTSLHGFGQRMQGAIPKGIIGAQQDLITNGFIPSYNPIEAKTLFNEVGFKGTITFTYNNDSLARLDSLQLLKQNIEALNIGINLTIQSLSWSSYLLNLFTNNFSIYQISYLPEYQVANDYVSSLYSCSGSFSQSENYCNPYTDSFASQAASSTTFFAQSSIYKQLEENATQDYPYIYLDQQQTILVTRDWINGLSDFGTNSLNPANIFPSFQYLTKYERIITSSSSSSTSFISSASTTSTSSSNPSISSVVTTTVSTSVSSITSNTSTTSGFELVTFLSTNVFFALMIRRKKKDSE